MSATATAAPAAFVPAALDPIDYLAGVAAASTKHADSYAGVLPTAFAEVDHDTARAQAAMADEYAVRLLLDGDTVAEVVEALLARAELALDAAEAGSRAGRIEAKAARRLVTELVCRYLDPRDYEDR